MMNKILLTSIFSFSIMTLLSQWNPNPTDSRLWNTTKSSFPQKINDIYIYSLKTDSNNYTAIITLQKVGDTITFDYSIPEKPSHGKMMITAQANNNAIRYDTSFTENGEGSTNRSILWLSKKNMTELILLKETTMDMGNGMETFYKGKNSIIKVKFKGKERIFTLYNAENTKGNIHFSVLSDIRNPLIVNSVGPFNISLKEIR